MLTHMQLGAIQILIQKPLSSFGTPTLIGAFIYEIKNSFNYLSSIRKGISCLIDAESGCTPKTRAVELLLACVGFYSDSKIIKISHSVSSV